MKVLVTGGTGFIGGYVVRELEARGHRPLVLDRQRDRAGGSVFLGDVRDYSNVYAAMATAEGFVHLAAILGTQETIQEPGPAAETNVLGSLNVFQAAAHHNVPGVYIGVGNHWMENTYSITKTCAERFVTMFNRERGARINIVRAMNAYGPGQVPAPPYGPAKVRKVTPSFVCRALSKVPIEIYGDGKQISDMVHVRDVAKVLVLAMEYAEKGAVFEIPLEVGPNWHTTINQLAELILKLTDSDAGVRHLPMRPGEQKQARVVANNKTLKYIGMDASELIKLHLGMRETVDWFKKYLQEN